MKRYRHVGTQPLVLEDGRRMPGEEFSAELSESYEGFLLRAGVVIVLPAVVAGGYMPPRPWKDEDVEIIAPERDAPAPKKKG